MRLGFGGNRIEATNCEKADISAGVSVASSPLRPMNAPLNAESPSRSPRQCSGSAPMMPTSVCVVMGPFIGCQFEQPPARPKLQFWLNVFMAPLGSPRSHAMKSSLPSMWQLPQEAWPRPLVRWVS